MQNNAQEGGFMKHSFLILAVCLLLSGSIKAEDTQLDSANTLLYAQIGMGTAATFALSYTLLKLYNDITTPQRYTYIHEKADQ